VNVDRWKKVDELFHEALEQPNVYRLPWLRVQCGADPSLFAEVSALLSSDEAAAGGFIRDKIAGAIVDFHENQMAVNRMRRVGPYRLIKEHGRGGMGTVFLAERADEQYNAKVAIKLIRPGMDTDFFLSRFRRERQTLARLQHANIARLLDSGTSDDGLPYIVMEWIDGKPINEYCRDNSFNIDQTLRLFVPVCAAVSHAHQNFVVHRDIKPGNILVDYARSPKLLDFGICKLLFAVPSEDATRPHDFQMMSPDYASPEQVRALPITVASDIYSLAAVLYELLSGRRPHRIDKYTPQAVERAICEEDVLPPSLVVNERSRCRLLSGDLDNILLRALHKVPERRYESVEQFADDLQRHLLNLPVSARPDTLGYRAGKFLRRNRGALTAGSAIALALCGGAIASAREAVRARRHAADARRLANAIIFEIHDLVGNLPGSLEAREKIIRFGIEHFDRLAATASNDAQLRREIAAAYERMGEVQANVLRSYTGDTEDALLTFEKALKLLQPLSDSWEVELNRILLLNRIADVQSYIRTGDEAMQCYNEALQRAKNMQARHTDDNHVLL
jgi:tRNA A-37 threonylcarbamoyl transferase component Bud32